MLNPLLKYPGGKTKELKYIIPSLPRAINNYYEPFVGGGSVFFAIANNAIQHPKHFYINDRSNDLMLLYDAVRRNDPSFVNMLSSIELSWVKIGEYTKIAMPELIILFKEGIYSPEKMSDSISEWIQGRTEEMRQFFLPKINHERAFFEDLPRSISRKILFLKKKIDEGVLIGLDDFEGIIVTAFKSAMYVYYRDIFNTMNTELDLSDGEKAAVYLYIRQYAYSSMFRYSKTGKFNVPYGGKSYNNNSLQSRLEYYESDDLRELLSATTIGNVDFEEFMASNVPNAGDFIFLDPPYDTDFSTYANNEFGKSEQERLANYLINDTVANWMLIIKNTSLISSLYRAGTPTKNGMKIYLNAFEKSYLVNFKNRNDKDVEHLIVTNYPIPILDNF